MEFRKSLSQASSELLQATASDSRQGSVLLIKHPGLPWPEVSCVERNQQSFGRALHLNLGKAAERYSGMLCNSQEMPFVEHSFRQIVLWHVLDNEQQLELAEACRVLAPAGELLILGLNPWGWRARCEAQARELPRLHAHRLVRYFPTLGLKLKEVRGAGFAGWGSAVVHQHGLSRPMLPFTDLLVLVAEHSHPATFSPLRLNEFQAGVAPTA
jgi:SAM-dependent methyltransferase